MPSRVLIVEDEQPVRQLMRITLEQSGYEVVEAATGEEGVAIYSDGSAWDVVLLDQRLPGIDGLEVLRRLRERNADAAVVMVTAYATIDLAVEAMKLGATDFLRKPTTPETIRGAVAGAIRSMASGGRLPRTTAVTAPTIRHLTLNGYQIERQALQQPSRPLDHQFLVTRNPDETTHEVVVSIDPEEVARVERLTGKHLSPTGAFWRTHAEQRLADHLWLEGAPPVDGHLVLRELPRTAIDLALQWHDD
jgi:DNA-binding response OmpR family regulator